jgi:hypothetical protein
VSHTILLVRRLHYKAFRLLQQPTAPEIGSCSPCEEPQERLGRTRPTLYVGIYAAGLQLSNGQHVPC